MDLRGAGDLKLQGIIEGGDNTQPAALQNIQRDLCLQLRQHQAGKGWRQVLNRPGRLVFEHLLVGGQVFIHTEPAQ